MQNLEYSESIPKCDYRKIHNCKRCPYVTRSIFFMVNHAKRHPLPLKSLSSERNDLEKFYCKDCNFETDLVVIFKQHLREYHRKDTDCVQDQPKNYTVVKSYICQKCTFETYSVLMWIKHLDGSCFNTKEECENISEEEWYQCECCSKTKEAQVLEKHQAAKQSLHHFHWYSCDKCEFKTKRNDSLKRHKQIHLSAAAIQWYNCDKCEFKTKRNHYLKRHKQIHLSADAVQWYSCDKCKYKTKHKDNFKKHNTIHHSAEASKCCDKCEFKTKQNDYLKEHKQRLVCLKPKVLPKYNAEKRLK
ncbi:hypothetical protein MTP99_015927 [Tenebrio molitor]|nr:hypothetical protein MTP99_015927 [Tenebrio molitor]